MRAEIGGTYGNYDLHEEASEDIMDGHIQRDGGSSAANQRAGQEAISQNAERQMSHNSIENRNPAAQEENKSEQRPINTEA